MLASITPLGERSRGTRWGRTVTAFVVGSTAGGAAIGTAAGAVGWALGPLLTPGVRLPILAAVLLAGLLIDLRLVPGVPGPRRQVNEQWLHRYRGWVYGLGFGAQLGAGVATIVTTAAVYATLAAAVLGGSPGWGAAIGASFGGIRGLSLLRARSIERPADLVRLDAGLRGWEPAARVAAAASLLAFASVAALAVVG